MKYFIVALFTFITLQAQADVICEGEEFSTQYKILLSTWNKSATVHTDGKHEIELFCSFDSATMNWDDDYPTFIECKEKNRPYVQLDMHIDSKYGKGSGHYFPSSDSKHIIYLTCSPTR